MEYYKHLIKSLNRKIRIILYQMKDLSFQNVEKRLANLLIRLSNQHGKKSENKFVEIEMELTHQELANMIASTRASVTRALNKFQKENLIKVDAKKYIILNKLKLSSWE